MRDEIEEDREFPVIEVEDLQNLWRLGNLLSEWAKDPRGMNEELLAELQILSEQYSLNSTRALFAFQQEWQTDIENATTARMTRSSLAMQAAKNFAPPMPIARPEDWALAQTIQQPLAWASAIQGSIQDFGLEEAPSDVVHDVWVAPTEPEPGSQAEANLFESQDFDQSTGLPLDQTAVDVAYLESLKRGDEPGLITHQNDDPWIEESSVTTIVPAEVLAEASNPKIPRKG